MKPEPAPFAADSPKSDPAPVFTLARNRDKYAAAGHAMMLLMRHDSFGGLPFRQIASIIAGQINRDHYFFVARNGVPTGFVGWALCSDVAGERWLRDNDASLIGNGVDGPCVVLNTWVADGTDMNSFLLGKLRDTFRDKTRLFARRRYADGRTRPIRINQTRAG